MGKETTAQIKLTPPPGATDEDLKEVVEALDLLAQVVDPDHGTQFMDQYNKFMDQYNKQMAEKKAKSE